MDILNNEILNMLIKDRKGHCLSIFTPTHRVWNEMDQDMLRFKNQVKEAERQLGEKGMTTSEINKYLTQLYRLSEDREFWNYQEDGLAVYIAENEIYNVKVPFGFREKIYLNKRFYTKYLLPIFNGDQEFFILSLDVHNIRLFRGYHYKIKEINLEKTPVNIDEALGLTGDGEKKRQFRAEISAGNSQRANFHGQGSKNDAAMKKRDILRFFEMVNTGVMHILRNEKAPMLLAGVEYEIPLYREANKYPNLLNSYLKIDADFIQPQELFDRANTLLEPYFESFQQKDLEKYGHLAGTEKTSGDAATIIKAGFENRISILFIDPEAEIWGQFDKNDYSVKIHSAEEFGDEDLVDLAATQTILHNGVIYTLDNNKMPNHRPMAAIFRY